MGAVMPSVAPLRWMSALMAAAVLTACASSPPPAPPSAPRRAGPEVPPALAEAIATWHDDGDLEPLAGYVAAHPDDDLGVWREVVALHRYEACATTQPDREGLRSVAREYPDTVGGNIAAVTLFGDGLGRLHAEIPGPLVVDFLDGGDAWARDAHGALSIGAAELERAREQYAPGLRQQLADALLAEGCDATMGYCNWWLSRQADAPQSAAVGAAVANTWSRRAHPTWQGGDHARCAVRCVKRCRPRAAPLDDSCFAPCYARC